MATLAALIRFHCRAGARVALRANAVVAGAVVFFYGMEDDAPARIRATTRELVARHAGWSARMKLAGICVALAGVAMPRVVLGATGWMRSLAISSATSRRASIAALCATQAFAILLAVLAICGAVSVYHASLDVGKVLGLPLLMFAAAATVLPVERKAGLVLAALALVCAVPGTLPLDGIAIAALIVGDRVAGGVARLRRRPVHPARLPLAWSSPVAQWTRLTTRSLPVSALIATALTPAIFIAFAYFIVLHNPELDSDTAHRTVRICGVLALWPLGSALSSTIVRTRPAWAWARSLPWSARQRVLGDFVLHIAGLAVVPIALLPLDWRHAVIVALLILPMTAGACAAIRFGNRRQTSAAGEIMLLGVVYGTLIALWPATVGLAVCATPVSLAVAVRRDQRLLVTRWEELHHDAAGDPAWTSAS